MPVTAVKVKGKDGKELRIQFMTTPEETALYITIYKCNESWIPVGRPQKTTEQVAEDVYHKQLRLTASEHGDYQPSYSTNPEWNPEKADEIKDGDETVVQ